MPGESKLLKREFQFGSTTVKIIEGTILSPGVKVNAVVSTDDNYLTMGSGVSKMLRVAAASEKYVQCAQNQCPVKAGTVVVTEAYRLKDILGADYVFHGTVIDYDTSDLLLEELVEHTTANCLAQAEERGLQSILFPALATGAGNLTREQCARRMCSAIKAYLGQERPLKEIYLILHLPPEPKDETERDKFQSRKAANDRFILEANLVLGVPYNPVLNVRQARDFFGRKEALKTLEDIVTGKKDVEGSKCHAVVLGGSAVGKWAILDQLYYQAQQPGSPLSVGRRLVKLTFGRVHANTPYSFIYRKFLCALGEEARNSQADDELLKEIGSLYADAAIDCSGFLDFLARHPDRYKEVVFLVDELPRLLEMEGEDTQEPKTVRAFWKDLDKLQEYVRFVYTGQAEAYQKLRRERLGAYASSFQDRIEEVWLKCVTDQERIEWVDALFNRYLDRSGGASNFVHDFFEANAGRHPYLISLAGYNVLEAIKRDLLEHPGQDFDGYDTPILKGFLENALKAIEQPRRDFFASLVDSLDHDHRFDLECLAKAVALEERERMLIPALEKGDPNVSSMFQDLAREGDPRESLHPDRLHWMEANGLLVDADEPRSAQFMAKSFAAYVFEIHAKSNLPHDQPEDVVISLLSSKPGMVRTILRGRGARATMSDKRLPPDVKDEFIKNFSGYIRQRFHSGQASGSQPSVFSSTEEVSNYILTQFTTVEIKRYLERTSQKPTILLMVDDAYKDIPWELMVEAVYAGEIPFRMGRSIVSRQAPQNVKPPVRGIHRIKALLIGDPAGNLDEAKAEVERLADGLRSHPELFDEPDLLIGPERCKRIQLLNALSSGRYGIVHYSGHTRFEGAQSAWQLGDGTLTTDMLTNAMQMAPPAFVFSSSCESAIGGEMQPVRYENQSFDLPGAFLQAGVEAYAGTLWQVDAKAARLFSEKFYEAFMSNAEDEDGEPSLGECLRQAKWALKQQEERNDQINWLSFILYGDPHLRPSDLFPLMRK
jgi:O-acetyl-ADP-ribose deacetylase (regulator of RNase III)